MTFYLETLITSKLQAWTTYRRSPEAQRPTQPQMQHQAQHVGPANHCVAHNAECSKFENQ